MSALHFLHTLQQKPVSSRRRILFMVTFCSMALIIAGWILAEKMVLRSSEYQRTSGSNARDMAIINKSPIEIMQKSFFDVLDSIKSIPSLLPKSF